MEEQFIRLLCDEWDPNLYQVRHADESDKQTNIKGSSEWFEALAKFTAKKVRMILRAEDISLERDGQLVLSAGDIRKVLNDNEGEPFAVLTERLTELLMSGLKNAFAGHEYTYPPAEQKKLIDYYQTYFTNKICITRVTELYEEFLFRQNSRNIDFVYVKDCFDLYDLAALAYLYKNLKIVDPVRVAAYSAVNDFYKTPVILGKSKDEVKPVVEYMAPKESKASSESESRRIIRSIPERKASSYDNSTALYYGRNEEAIDMQAQVGEASEFGMMPGGTSLLPPRHGRINHAVLQVDTKRSGITITGSYGVLRIMPVADDKVRVIFKRGGGITDVIDKASGVKWKAIQNREYVEARLPKLTVRVERKSGAVSFLSRQGKLLLSENPNVIRQYAKDTGLYWNYFLFGDKERLNAQSENPEKWISLERCAKYVSHGDSDISTIIMSANGYRLEIACGVKILVNTIPSYPMYIRYEGADAIDYCFQSLI